MIRNIREEYDHERQFVVANRGLKFQGVRYSPGERFANNLADPRKLRQLYDQRYLNMLPADTPAAPTGPDLTIMTMDELRDWLREHGLVARFNWDRAKLLDRAQAILAGDAKQAA